MSDKIEKIQDELDIKSPNCKWCNTELDDIIEHYDHDGGRQVEGFSQRQWLYTTCSGCDYQWALHKLGL